MSFVCGFLSGLLVGLLLWIWRAPTPSPVQQEKLEARPDPADWWKHGHPNPYELEGSDDT